MNRRAVMVSAGGIGAATIGAFAFAGSASANADAQANFEFDTVSGESDDGALDEVNLWAWGAFQWEGLDEPAEYAQINLMAFDPENQGYSFIEQTEVDVASATSGQETFDAVGGGLLENTEWESGHFRATEDSGSEETTVTVHLNVVIHAGESSVDDTLSTELPVSMENLESGGGFTEIGTDAEVEAETVRSGDEDDE